MGASVGSLPRRWRPPLLTALLLRLGEGLCRSRPAAAGINAAGVRRWRERVELAKPLGTARQLRLAFASDLHAGRLTPTGTITAALEALREATPDLILLGGDFVCSRAQELELIADSLRRLQAPAGVFAVMGNHDHGADVGTITARLEGFGVSVLRNRGVRLAEPFANVLLVGLDDHLGGRPRPEAAPWDPRCATLLLMHQPSGLLDAGDRPFDLAFAGHTHGGQITLPGGWAPLAASGALSRRYPGGRYALPGERVLCVSAGVGNSLLPLRFGPRTEVLILDLVGAGAEAAKGDDDGAIVGAALTL
ncbi:MAG: metallophosphoesterase [Cyanobacteria bacterium K_Offshore_surface_m2_239]|nr:metallophosphoesterase [Cyanobacteria bacterium K_Offshore_surface_m2_239]